MSNIALFIDSGTYREDYARVYDAIYLELESKNLKVATILGPDASIEVETRFEHFTPLSLDRSEAPVHLSLIALVMYLNALRKKMRPVPRRKPWLIITKYRNFLACVKLLERLKPSALLSIKFDSFYELVSAANMMKIPTVAIQHGEDYLSVSAKYHEWPASILLVWSEYWAVFHKERFQNQALYHSIDSILWHAKYAQRTQRKNEYIVIFESNSSLDYLLEQYMNLPFRDLIKIKPHPWREDNNCSYAKSRFPSRIYDEYLWDSIPNIAISFGSTITNEVIYHDCPCITICQESLEIGLYYPITGSFLLTQPTKNIIEIINRLISDQEFYSDFSDRQKEESIRYVKDSKPEQRIAEYMMKMVEK
jgi:hypothetical protein